MLTTRTHNGRSVEELAKVIQVRERPMKISARNQLKGKIIEVKKGATTAHVRLEIAPGQIVTAAITNEAANELGLKSGDAAIALIKASNVMIAID